MSEATPMITTAELAKRLAVSQDTALRILAKEPGVIRIKNGARTIYRVSEQWFTSFLTRKSKPIKRGQQ